MALFQNTLPADSIRVNTSHPPVSRWRFVANKITLQCRYFLETTLAAY